MLCISPDHAQNFDWVPGLGNCPFAVELLQQFEQIRRLKEEDRATIKSVIKAMIIKNQMERVINQ